MGLGLPRWQGQDAQAKLELQPLGSKAATEHAAADDVNTLDQEYGVRPVQRSWANYFHTDGGWLLAACHIVTAIIGAGVLGLPNAISWLGWVAGLSLLVLFFVVALWASLMLTEVYEVGGKTHPTYRQAVLHILGPKHAIAIAVFQYLNLVLCAIGYTVAAGQSIKTVADNYCGAESRLHHCKEPIWQAALGFGVSQLFFSQMPNLESAWWSSAIGAAMSVLYSALALGLSISQAGNSQGSLLGRSAEPSVKVFGVFNALGAISFAYSFTSLLLEIQDTLHTRPVQSMKRAVTSGLSLSFMFYVAVSVAGYMALGDSVPGDILTGFMDGPSWVVNMANVFVLIHMVSAYQVFSQPVFIAMEGWLVDNSSHAARLPPLALRTINRSIYVCCTTLVACIAPFFSEIIGLVGALVFWPSAVLYPVLLWSAVYAPARWLRRLMAVTVWGMAAVALVAVIGALHNIIVDSYSYHAFGVENDR